MDDIAFDPSMGPCLCTPQTDRIISEILSSASVLLKPSLQYNHHKTLNCQECPVNFVLTTQHIARTPSLAFINSLILRSSLLWRICFLKLWCSIIFIRIDDLTQPLKCIIFCSVNSHGPRTENSY